jgi:hypothetical protein
VRRNLRDLRFVVGVGLAAAAGAVIAVLLLGGDDESGSGGGESGSTTTTVAASAPHGPELVSLDQLRGLPDSAGHAVYWAGEQSGDYELTIASDGSVFIRYLPQGVPVGSREATSLTVATYPYADAFSTLESAARQPGATRDEAPGGGVVVGSEANPNTVYVAYPDVDLQIEVYDPEADRALELATSGAIEPIV